VGEKPLPGRRKARRLRPGTRSTWENVKKTVARQCWTHSDIFPFFLWDGLPPVAANARAHRGVKACGRKHNNNEVVALWMIERRMLMSGAKKKEQKKRGGKPQ